MSSHSLEISFRPIGVSDVPNLVRWQREAEVAIWWGEADKSEDEIAAKWLRRAEGSGSDYDRNTIRYVIVVDGNDIGLIQSYDLRHYPAHAAEVGIPNAAGLDIFVGESEWRNKGIGTSIVQKFVEEYVFAIPGIETCVIDPDPENKRAMRSYEKAGFEYVKSYYSNENKMNVYLMRQERGQR